MNETEEWVRSQVLESNKSQFKFRQYHILGVWGNYLTFPSLTTTFVKLG